MNSFLQFKDSQAKRPYATQIFPLILGTQTEEAMKSANSCLVSNEIKPINNELCIFLPSIQGNKTKQIIGYIDFFARNQEKAEETMDYTYCFLQRKETKPGHDVLCKFLSSI